MMIRRAARALSSASAAAATKPNQTWWAKVEMGPKDPILGVTEKFNADPEPTKLNLGVGAYRDDNGKPVVLKSVAEAQHRILHSKLDNEYIPIGGTPKFIKSSLELAYEDLAPLKEGRVVGLQALSGTGALRIAGAFVKRFKEMPVYVPNPTWGNHFPIFRDSGLKVSEYRYYDANTRGLDLAGLLEDVKAAPDQSLFLFHACAHNPTGVDPSLDQWKKISDAVGAKGHFVLFDSAYQGFASGDPSRDSAAIHHFVREGHQIGLCQSFAKNFGLYGHRVGTLSFITSGKEEAARVESQLKIVARAMYSSPPLQGSRIVTTIWEDPELRKQWYADVKEMADRIIKMRALLVQGLKDAGSKHKWNHITDQIGMFCYSGMTAQQVDQLINKHHVYLTSNGRISMAGVTSKNVKQLAAAIHDVTK